MCVEEMCVLRSAWSDLFEVISKSKLQLRKRLRTFHAYRTQVRDIKDDCVFSTSKMFRKCPLRVLQWHVPATEWR